MIWFREWKYNIIFHPLQCSFIQIWFYNLQCGICLQWTVFTLYFPSTLSSIWLKLNSWQGRKKAKYPSYFYDLYRSYRQITNKLKTMPMLFELDRSYHRNTASLFRRKLKKFHLVVMDRIQLFVSLARFGPARIN